MAFDPRDTSNRESLSARQVAERFVELFHHQDNVVDAFMAWVHPDYIQHNPNAPSGRDATLEVLAAAVRNNPELTPRREAGDLRRGHGRTRGLVVVHHNFRRTKGERGWAVVDIMRIKDGYVVEHWDVMQEVPETATQRTTGCSEGTRNAAAAGRKRKGPQGPFQGRLQPPHAHRARPARRAYRPRRALQAHRHRGGVDLPGAGQGAGRVFRERRGAEATTSLKMAAMFSKMPSAAGDAAGPRRSAHRAHGRIRDRPAAPAADRARRAGGQAGRRHRARPRGQRPRRRCLRPPSRPLQRLRRVRPARRRRLGQGDRAGGGHAQAQRRGAQLALPGPLYRRAGLLADPRGARGERPRALYPPDRALSTRRTTRPAASSARSAASRTTCGCTRWG